MGTIRLILALTVVLAHSSSIFGLNFLGGKLAVQAFYIISGFYMTLVLKEKYIKQIKSYRLFITNRFLRLYPIYWAVLLLSVLYSLTDPLNSNNNEFAALSYYLKYYESMNAYSFTFLFFTNIFIFLQDTVMFLGLNTSTGDLFFTPNFKDTNPELFRFLFVPQGWTIGIELTFYVIAPFLVRLSVRKIVLIIVISLTMRIILHSNGFAGDPWSYRFFPLELAFFLLGSLSYHIYNRINKMNVLPIYLKICWYIVLLFAIIYNFIEIPGKSYLYLATFFLSLPFVFILTKNWVYDRYIGELSYPVYISHIFILSLVTSLKLLVAGSLGLTVSIVSILFSIFLNEILIKRIEKIRQRRTGSVQRV